MNTAGTSTQTPSGSPPTGPDAAAIQDLKNLFAAQKDAFGRGRTPTLAERQQHLGMLAGMLMNNRERIQAAVVADFAVHPEQVTYLTEVLSVVGQAMYVMEQLPQWMADEDRFVDPNLFGSARATIRYEPKGVIGLIAPWNFPFLLSLGPVVDMLAAGNRVIIKPSEHTPACSELLRHLVARTFAPEHVAVVTGGLDLAKVFPTLRWDHLLYTGSTAVGREVAVAAARNLVPVTLELGGKNPAIVHSDSVDAETVRQIVGNKVVKSGQVCIAPDYCLVPRGQVDTFVELAKEFLSSLGPRFSTSQDSVGIVSEHHLDRLVGLLDEAVAAGTRVVRLEPEAEVERQTRQMPVSLVVDPGDDLMLMREEIFGPILPIKPYDTLEEAIGYVNRGEVPLGLYVFAKDDAVAQEVLNRTRSGGACVNTCAIQGVLPALGFGGAGASGNGRHRGIEGFREFSIARGVVQRGHGDVIDAFFPPYQGMAQAVINAALNAG